MSFTEVGFDVGSLNSSPNLCNFLGDTQEKYYYPPKVLNARSTEVLLHFFILDLPQYAGFCFHLSCGTHIFGPFYLFDVHGIDIIYP
jgi:hypothetical protein